MATQLNLDGFSRQYDLDIPELDEQHEAFFAQLARVGEVVPDLFKVLEEDEVDDLLDVLSELRDYALNHFSTEEAYMEEVDYPGLGEQQAEHKRFITEVIRMESELMNGAAKPAIQLHRFMHDWLRNHILTLDKPLGEYYNKHKK